jgi:dTDP-4-dehydrorhamnose 3,5-epimerase
LIETEMSGVKILVPKVYEDDRGFFMESFNRKEIENMIGIKADFVQDNHSHSKKNVLRGLHYQIEFPQGKLVRAVEGAVYDVVVDLSRSSPTFGQWMGVILSKDNRRILWVPPTYAHGFLVLSATADVLYKTTDYYQPTHERCLCWNDPDLSIEWPLDQMPLLSLKDQQGLNFKNIEAFA